MNDLKRKINLAIAQKERLKDELTKKKIALEAEQDELNEALETHAILANISQRTQEKFKEHIEGLVTLAINSVFVDRDFSFQLKFEQKANRVVCEPIVYENDIEFKPKDDLGGGIIDIISFALRIVLWGMENPKKRNVLILDEPFKWTGQLMELAGKMTKEISSKLGIQVILITHDKALIDIADKAWEVKLKNGISKVKEI